MSKKSKKHTLLRLLKYITSRFKKQLAIIILAIIISSVCHVYGQLFLQTLIDDYITPLIGLWPLFILLVYLPPGYIQD